MSDTKNTILIIAAIVAIFLGVIFGLSKMSSSQLPATSVDVQTLVEGARFVQNTGEVKATVVVFADIQCPSCKAAESSLSSLRAMDGVSYVVRHFPLPPNIHKYALISAKAVEAGRVLGKGWEMMEVMFDKQSEWSESNDPEKLFVEYATSLGISAAEFEEKMNSSEVADLVQQDVNLANSLKLSGTPTIFVNGEQIGAPFVLDKVKEILSK